MTFKKTPSVGVRKQTAAKYGIHSRRLISVSKEHLESLSTLRLHCNLCKRWLPALAFYAQVEHPDSKSADEVIYLERYEIKAEGFKGRETVVICEDCAAETGTDSGDKSSHQG